MDYVRIYKCLCSWTRLRIVNLLQEGPLCVCHLGEILDLEQPKVSRHLKALKEAGTVETQRCYNWTIYRITDRPNALLEANLKCLQDLRAEKAQFRTDLERRGELIRRIEAAPGETFPEAIRCLAQGTC